jgi:cation/acetate symporter
VVTTGKGGTLVDGLPQGLAANQRDLTPVGAVAALPGGATSTGPLGPLSFLRTFNGATIETWTSERRVLATGGVAIVHTPREQAGSDLLQAGASPTFKGVRGTTLFEKLDFLSLMLALFAGTASLPHILIRYYTVKDVMAVRKSTVVGIGAIGLFYVLTLYLGLGAMTSGALDVTNNNMAAPLLARSFSEPLFAVISAIAFTTVLGTVSGLILAASGAVVHDLLSNVVRMDLSDDAKVRAGKMVAVAVGIVAMLLGIAFERLNVSFLVGWAFNVAASANLPSLVMLLFWKRTTKQGIATAILVGMATSLLWILCSAQAFRDVYGWPPEQAPVPFSQPGIVTIPLGFLVLIVVSLFTSGTARTPATQTP